MFVMDVVENLEFLEAYALCVLHTKEHRIIATAAECKMNFKGDQARGKRPDQSL